MNIKSNMLTFPPTAPFTPTPRTATLALDSGSSFLSPDSTNPVDNLKRRRGHPHSTVAKLKASSEAAHRILALALTSIAGEHGSWACISSLGQVAAR